MSGAVILILCMTPAAVLVLLMAMSVLERRLLDCRHSVDDSPADPLSVEPVPVGVEVIGVEQSR